jgi:hypothetical protein
LCAELIADDEDSGDGRFLHALCFPLRLGPTWVASRVPSADEAYHAALEEAGVEW